MKPFVPRDAPEPRSPEDLATLQERLERLLDRALRDGAAAEQGMEQSAEVRALRWWDIATGWVVPALHAHGSRVFACAVTPDGAVISASQDCTLKVWDAERRVCLCTHHGDGMFGAVAATAGAIVAGDEHGIVWILDWPPAHPHDMS